MDRVSKSVNYYVCVWPQSKYQTKEKSHLTQHILIDSEEKKFKCSQNGCNKRFKRRYISIEHKLKYLGIQKFVCHWNQCGKRFKTNHELEKHKSGVHLKEKKFICNECHKGFNTKQHLTLNSRIRSGEKQFHCNYKKCNQKFSY